MKDETTLKEVINDLAKMTGREVSKEKKKNNKYYLKWQCTKNLDKFLDKWVI